MHMTAAICIAVLSFVTFMKLELHSSVEITPGVKFCRNTQLYRNQYGRLPGKQLVSFPDPPCDPTED